MKNLSKDPVKEGVIKEGDVAFMDDIISEEDLPYKYVYYPGHYGAYFAFSKERDDVPYFCSCSRKSIETYIASRLKNEIPLNAHPERYFILDSMYFPLRVVKDLVAEDAVQDCSIINKLKFKEGLCHVCNKKIPKYEYCHKMYGGKFARMYGWYINQEKFQLGIDPIWHNKDIDVQDYPLEVKELLQEIASIEKPLNYWQLRQGNYSNKEWEKNREAEKNRSRLSRKLGNYFENLVRIKLGYKKVGESWVTETALFYMIKNLYPKAEVLQHYHPPFLDGLELDIFIKDQNVGIEYQGIQHFKSVKHWGGEESLKEVKKRDHLKKRLCEKNNVTLIYFYYNENVTENLIVEKLENVMEKYDA